MPLAAIPPGTLWPQVKVLPQLYPLLPRILGGQAFLPPERMLREVPLSTLSAAEQHELVPCLVKDAGRVFEEMSLGASCTRVNAAKVPCLVLCVSVGQDRDTGRWISRHIARRNRAEYQVHPRLPHWIIVESAVGEVAPPAHEWLTKRSIC